MSEFETHGATPRERSLRIDHFPGDTAVYDELRAGDEAAIGADQKGNKRGDILNTADAPGRVERVFFSARLWRLGFILD
jgi:hypothetical protein